MGLKIGGFDMTDIKAVGGDTTPKENFPWEVTTETDESKRIIAKIRPGSISEVIPSNIFDPFPLSNGINFFKVKCQCSNSGVNTARIVLDSSNAPINSAKSNSLPTELWVTVAVAVVTTNNDGNQSVKTSQIHSSNLRAYPFVSFLESSPNDDINGEPFIRWWGWSFESVG